MACRKIAFLVALACAAPSAEAGDPSRCYNVRDPDLRAGCLAGMDR